MDIKNYLEQFGVLNESESLSNLLYFAILNRFRVVMNNQQYITFKIFQEKVFNLVESMRKQDSEIIAIVFDYLSEIDIYLIDVIIMLWCLPRADTYLSKRFYNKHYEKNIQKHNYKMIKNIEHKTVKSFCMDTLTKTNNVPVHCIDYLWYYMNGISLEFSFYNYESGDYIGFSIPQGDFIFLEFGFNMEKLLELGLGQIIYQNGNGSFRNFIKNLITDIDIVKKILNTSTTNHNYFKQLLNITNDPSKYFGNMLKDIPPSVISEIENFRSKQ